MGFNLLAVKPPLRRPALLCGAFVAFALATVSMASAQSAGQSAPTVPSPASEEQTKPVPAAPQGASPAQPATQQPGAVRDASPAAAAPPVPMAVDPAPKLEQPSADAQSNTEAPQDRQNSPPSQPAASPEKATAAAPATDPHGSLSAMRMFMSADPVVKAVMVLLAAASVVAWTILIVMLARIISGKRRIARSNTLLARATSLQDAERLSRDCHAHLLLDEAVHELQISAGLPAENIVERAKLAMRQVEQRVSRGMTFGLGMLAIIGSTGPFVGLFGTVWGIMNSFISIANSHTTNLSVVAPGIAEALLATAIGLVAAIPAVMFYNILTRQANSYRALVTDAESFILRHLSRDLDRRDRTSPELDAMNSVIMQSAASHMELAKRFDKRAGG